jgi:very-short-patch-repair endonuclease
MPKKSNKDFIIETIKDYGPIKANKIAEILSIDRNYINRILYSGEMKKYIVRDKSYRWSFIGTKKESKETKIKNADPLLNKLCRYYLNCLSREQIHFGTFARSKFDLQYAQLSNFDITNPDFSYIEAIDSDDFNRVKALIKKTQKGFQNKNPQQPSIGYPIYLDKITTPKGEWFFAVPIFVITINSADDTMQDIRLNARAIESILGTQNMMTRLGEMNSISEFLELHANSDDITLISEMLANLKSKKPDWPWSNDFSNYDNEIDLSKTDESGIIYNVAIYTGMDQSKYTRGLESELQKLSQMSTKDISGTALHHWLYPEDGQSESEQVDKNLKIIEPIPLNNEQRKSIERALSKKLSVISGPPGTGKSQVVSNLLVNSIYNNKSVLFSSKNNQAVDVVINRTNQLSTTPVLLHLSKQRKYSKLKQYCERILSYVPNQQTKLNLDKNEKQLSKLKQQITNVDKEENLYRDAVSKSQEIYKNLFKETKYKHKLNEKGVQEILQIVVFQENRSLITIYGSKLNAMLKLLEKLNKSFKRTNSSITRTVRKNIKDALKYYSSKIDPSNRGFLGSMAWGLFKDDRVQQFRYKLKKLNNYNSSVPLKLKHHRFSLKNIPSIEKSLLKDLDYIEKYSEMDHKVNCDILGLDSSEDFIKSLKELNTLAKKLYLDSHKINKKNIFVCKQSILNNQVTIKIYKDFIKYLKNLEKIRDMDNSFDLSKKIIDYQEEIQETSVDVWEDYTKVRISKFDKNTKKDIREFKTMLGFLEKENINDGDTIKSSNLAVKFNQKLNKVMKIAPCWSVTSLSAKSKIPFHKKQFELLVIDEASQNDIASVLPLLYRCERAVIIGDEKQLRHISSINKKEDWRLLESYDLMENNILWSYSQNSLFFLADSFVEEDNKVDLLDHFRSHGDIIKYANDEFYGGSLRIATDYKNLKVVKGEQIIRWININGKATRPSNKKSLINYDETKAIIQELSRLKSINYEGSIGVVTPYRAQANLIQKELHKDETLYNWFIVDRGGSINTVHLFQGDERDIMFFSTVVTKDINPSVMNFFKPNLFNVAITRARAALWVFGNQEDCLNFDHEELASLANYINNIHSKVIEDDVKLPEFKDNKYPHSYVKELGVKYSEWEVLFYEALYKHKIRTIPQYSVDQYKLDLALFDENNPDRKLNIEIDGVEYHRDARGELIIRDRIRNLRMIELGWDVKRFWVHDVRDNLDECVNEVLYWINNAMNE